MLNIPVLDQFVEIRWNANNRKHYESLGYIFTSYKEKLTVKASDLTNNAEVMVEIECDHCKDIVLMNNRNLKNKDRCYCSKVCSDTSRRGKAGKNRGERIKYNCDYCDKENETTPSYLRNGLHKFCNHECASHFSKGKPKLKLRKRQCINCYSCNKEFELPNYRVIANQRHFCSRECQNEWQMGEEYSKIHKKNGTVLINCDNCSKEFTQKRVTYEKNKTNYCSLACKNESKHKWKLHNPNPKKEKVLVNCFHCKSEKLISESKFKKNKYHFCSRDCYSKWRSYSLVGEKSPLFKRVSATCDQCNINIELIPYEAENGHNNFCSQECYWKYRSINYTGENHPHYGKKLSQERIDLMRQGLVARYANGDFPRNTSIQEAINAILDDLSIKYINEYNCKYYSIDNYLEEHNLMIEVMGDYWHSNPNKYSNFESLNKLQKDGVRRDKSKRTYIKRYKDISVLYLWETDIKRRLNLCSELILKYVESEGILQEYNSFNYELDHNNNLILKQNIVKPFFIA